MKEHLREIFGYKDIWQGEPKDKALVEISACPENNNL